VRKYFVFRILVVSLILLVLLGTTIFAATWEFKYPTNAKDTSAVTRAYYPVNLGYSGQTLIDADKIASSGLDTNMQIGTTSIKYMMATDRVMAVIPSLPANGSQQVDLYTGYAPAQVAFPIIVGDNGYVTMADAAALEFGASFESEFSGYVNTATSGVNQNLIIKDSAYKTYVNASSTVKSYIYIAPATFTTSASDGYLEEDNGVYLTAQADTTADTVESGGGFALKVGQNTDFKIWRSFVYFDTSAIPNDVEVTSAYLVMNGDTDTSTTDFNIYIQSGMPTYPHDPLVVADYDKTFYGSALLSDPWNSSTFVAGNNVMYLNSTGCSAINLTGYTKLCLRSEEDINASQPTTSEWVTFESVESGTDPYIVITYAYAVSDNTVTSGEHVIKTTYDGANIKLYVDAVEKDSQAFVGSVINNANNWIIDQNETMPYITYYKHTVGGVEIVEYQPNTMISGTVLPDLDGGDQNGAITWGANTSVTLTYGTMESSGSTSAVSSGLAQGFDPGNTGMPSTWFATGDITDLPFYDSFSQVSAQTGQPVRTIYFLGMLGVAIGLFLIIVTTTRSALLAVMGLNIALFVGSSMEVIPMWIPFAVLIIQIGIMYLYRQVAY